MNPDQTDRLLEALETIASGLSMKTQYTLTGAADWDMLLILAGMFGAIFISIGSFMYLDLRAIVKEIKTDQSLNLGNCKADCKTEFQKVWNALGDCQSDCCPRKK